MILRALPDHPKGIAILFLGGFLVLIFSRILGIYLKIQTENLTENKRISPFWGSLRSKSKLKILLKILTKKMTKHFTPYQLT